MTEPHEGLIVTPFEEFRRVYEYRKAQALVTHLRRIANLVEQAETVAICHKAPERPWIGLQEWTSPAGIRLGQWQTDIEIARLA